MLRTLKPHPNKDVLVVHICGPIQGRHVRSILPLFCAKCLNPTYQHIDQDPRPEISSGNFLCRLPFLCGCSPERRIFLLSDRSLPFENFQAANRQWNRQKADETAKKISSRRDLEIPSELTVNFCLRTQCFPASIKEIPIPTRRIDIWITPFKYGISREAKKTEDRQIRREPFDGDSQPGPSKQSRSFSCDLVEAQFVRWQHKLPFLLEPNLRGIDIDTPLMRSDLNLRTGSQLRSLPRGHRLGIVCKREPKQRQQHHNCEKRHRSILPICRPLLQP